MNDIFWGLLCIVASIAWAEFTEWAPWLAQRILNATVKQFPKSQQERMSEELSGLLNEAPGKLWKLWTATSLWWGFSREQLLAQFSEDFLEAMLRTLDLIHAFVFLVVFGPICIIIYLSIRLSSGGPAFVSQKYIGKHGKSFDLYIFQTIRPNSDDILMQYLMENEDELESLNEFGYIKYDPRITALGRFLHKTGLYILPEYFSLLKGDVSIVGPGARRKDEQDIYGKHWETYCKVKPGLVRVWHSSMDKLLSNAQRVELEVEYIKNRSFWKTVVTIAKNVKDTITVYGIDKIILRYKK